MIPYPMLLISLLAGVGAARAGTAVGAELDPPILLRRCTLEYERSSQVGAIYAGANATTLGECLVRPGDRVKQGQVLGRLQNRDLEVDLERNRMQAENRLDIQLSENKLAQLSLRVKRSGPLVGKNFMNTLDFDLLKLEAKAAALEVEKAKYTQSLAELQRKELAIILQNRDFRSPHDGIVVEVLKHAGERVLLTDHDPAFVVVDDTHLLVTGALDVGDAWRVKSGCRVRVVPEVEGVDLPIEKEEFPGEVVFVDQRIDPVSRTCKVVALVPNRGSLLRSGLEARMEIGPPSAAQAARPDAPDKGTHPVAGEARNGPAVTANAPRDR